MSQQENISLYKQGLRQFKEFFQRNLHPRIVCRIIRSSPWKHQFKCCHQSSHWPLHFRSNASCQPPGHSTCTCIRARGVCVRACVCVCVHVRMKSTRRTQSGVDEVWHWRRYTCPSSQVRRWRSDLIFLCFWIRFGLKQSVEKEHHLVHLLVQSVYLYRKIYIHI